MSAATSRTSTPTPTLPEAQQWLREHLEQRKNPFNAIGHDAAARHIEALPGTDPRSWAGHWLAGAEDFATRARRAEESGDREEALENWWQAYQNASADLCLALEHGAPRRPGCSPAATWARGPYCPPSSTG
ncbi:hypothetical protein ACFVT2_07385 [Streptomyces sp. NPDC058000]|uniref:hypothetical protein n=1 Tax=Streptomyces sp. NPDC058000 TaxID=3346299 RepID=UPI0036F17FB6